MSEQKRQIETANQLIHISELTLTELAEVRRLADNEITERTAPNHACRTYSMGRYLQTTGLLGPHGNIQLAEVGIGILRGWRQFIAEEIVERDPGWISFLLPPWTERSAGGYRNIITSLDAVTVGELTTLFLGEVKHRGLALGAELAAPGVADNALEATVRHLIRTEPQAALDAFRSLETFCASVRREMETAIACAAEPAAAPPAAAEVSEEWISWRSLRLIVAANPDVGQKRDEVLNPIDRWRWLHMLRSEGREALGRCGLSVTREDGHSAPVNPVDWTGFPTEPGQL